jgi:hypothetical protein
VTYEFDDAAVARLDTYFGALGEILEYPERRASFAT